MRRRHEALRRLGASVCNRCRRVASVRYDMVPDWTKTPIEFFIGLCGACKTVQEQTNHAHVKRSVEDKFATDRDLYRAQNEDSSAEYRRACAAMQPDVDEVLGGWKMGPSW